MLYHYGVLEFLTDFRNYNITGSNLHQIARNTNIDETDDDRNNEEGLNMFREFALFGKDVDGKDNV